MTIVVRPSASRRERLLDRALGLDVERARGLVEDEHGRVAQDRAGDRDALLLAAGEAEAALADDGVVALGQRRDDVVDLGGAGGLLDLLVGRVRPREAQVLAHRGVEEVGLLRDDADRVGERVEASARARRRRRSSRRRARRRRAARRGSRAWSCPSRSRRRSPCACRPGRRGRRPRASRRRRRSGTRRRRGATSPRGAGERRACPAGCRPACRGTRRRARTARSSS